MVKITELSHKLILEAEQTNLAVDMTSGRGNDTLFLAKRFKKVISFDIQQEAIDATTAILKTNNIDNVTLIRDSHANLISYVKEKVDLAIYNLGYLPSGNKDVKTESSSTIASLTSALEILNSNGLIIIVLYPHNPEETNAVIDFTVKLSSDYDCLEYKVLNRSNCPFIISIKKVK